MPVIGFDTGSLSEIVQGDAGTIGPLWREPWKLEKPDIPALANAAMEVLDDQDRFRTSARERAETVFDVENMVDEYLKVLLAQALRATETVMTNEEIIAFLKVHLQSIQENDIQTYKRNHCRRPDPLRMVDHAAPH